MSAARLIAVCAMDERTDGTMLRVIVKGTRDEVSPILEAIEKSPLYDFYQYQRVQGITPSDATAVSVFLIDMIDTSRISIDRKVRIASTFINVLTE